MEPQFGRGDGYSHVVSCWVTSYGLYFSLDGQAFQKYGDVDGNIDQSGIVYHQIIPTSARYVRFYATGNANGDTQLRVELYSCMSNSTNGVCSITSSVYLLVLCRDQSRGEY